MEFTPDDQSSREELIKNLSKSRHSYSKLELRTRFLQNKLKVCQVTVNSDWNIEDEENTQIILGRKIKNLKLEDQFVNSPEKDDYFKKIYRLRKRIISESQKEINNPWKLIELGLDKNDLFKSWIRFRKDDWNTENNSIRSNPDGASKNYYLTSPNELIGPEDDFYISYKARSTNSPCDLSLVVGGDLTSNNAIVLPDVKGYCFAFGAFYNHETHLQIRGNQSSNTRSKTIIEKNKVHFCEAVRKGGHIKMTIDGREIINYYDPFPIMGKGHGFVSLYTFAPDQYFFDLKVRCRPTCLHESLIEDVKNCSRAVLELKHKPNHFVEIEYFENYFLIHDITEIVEAQNKAADIVQKQLIREKSIEKIEMVGQLAAGTAHNFNNSLMIIQGLAELIGQKLDSESRSSDFINKLIHQCKNSAQLVRQLLDYSNQRMLASVPVNINEIVRNVLLVIENTFISKIKVESSISDQSITIKGDQSSLETALLNLAINSRDAMPNGGLLKLMTSIVKLNNYFFESKNFDGKSGEFACISVVDSGDGIPSEITEKVFEPFFTTKPKGKGTGLGLSSVYGTIKGHNGFIELNSEIGKGSQFDIYIPINEENIIQKEKKYLKQIKSAHNEKVILVLDDEFLITNILELAFTDIGFKVICFNSSLKAVEYYKSHCLEIDLVILDIIMPDLNGIECFDSFLEIKNNTKCIFMSGHQGDENEYTDLVQRDGVFTFVKKPFDLSEMIKLINNFFSEKKLIEQQPQ
ncbi:MAG: hypothetical protein COA79_26645 [Planctomycetota bacterium]|nr:MAG: hypothetical protein COA79_26645 [Planctomycetota bacterium]